VVHKGGQLYGGGSHNGKRTHTRDESRRVHGEDATMGEVWVMTGGGMRLQRSIARVNPSTMDKGSSVPSDTDGRTGIYSTIACAAMYNPGETPENMKDGRIPSRGPAHMERSVCVALTSP
jgi:hypothetical protein